MCVCRSTEVTGLALAGRGVEHPGFPCLRDVMDEVCSIDMYLHARIKIICPP